MTKIQVYDSRDKFAFECGDDEARALVSDGRAVRRYESAPNDSGERVYHLRLVARLNAPNWISGTHFTEAERMPNGLVVHSPKRAAAALLVRAWDDVGEQVGHAQCCLALDEEAKVASLPSKKAAAYVLYVIWGYTCEEVAGLLGIPDRTACRYVDEGIKSVRRRMEAENSWRKNGSPLAVGN